MVDKRIGIFYLIEDRDVEFCSRVSVCSVSDHNLILFEIILVGYKC